MRNQQTRAAAQYSEKQAFCKKLPQQTAATCAEGQTHGDLNASRHCSRDQEISNIRRCNQEDDGDDHQQHMQRARVLQS